ncbi:MAG: sugar ABC transporter permease [Candidatus Riflebacteria bacterium]|nr:sugar ABC transporter permease [Candidatus Riflebacteria bacterium]
MVHGKKIDFGAYGYLLPVVFIILCFQVIPIFYSLAISFYEWDLMSDPNWVGAENFRRLADDPMFYKSLVNTLYYAIFSVPLSILSALCVAMLLNNPIAGMGIYRTIYFLPVITSLNAVSIVWNFIYHPEYGLLNKVLAIFHIAPRLWLQDPLCIMPFLAGLAGVGWPDWLPAGPSMAMLSIIVMSVWKGLGYNVIIFLAGLQNIPKHLYEAATIDGASRWQQFRHITWPLLSPTTFFVFTMSCIGSFQVFSQIYMMTPRGGPMKSTMVIVFYLYQKAFVKFEFGYALAIAFVLFVMVFAMTLFNKLYLEKKVHYS